MSHPNNPPLGLAGRIASVFLRNTGLSILSIALLAVWGIASFFFMAKQYNPEIVAPAFLVSTDFPGARADEVYEFVTRPIEDSLYELPAIDEISSESHPGGKSVIMVKFLVGSNSEDAKVAINQKLFDQHPLRPHGVAASSVVSIDPDDVPILDIGLSSDDLSESSLRKAAFDIADQVKLVPGVSKIAVKGGRTNHLQVELDGSKLALYNLSVNEVLEALNKENSVYALQTLTNDTFHPTLTISGTIPDTEALARVSIRNAHGSLLRLGDVATLSLGPGEITSSVRRTEHDAEATPVIHIALSKLKGANSTDVSEAVLAELKRLETGFIPNDIRVSILNDEGKTASNEISKLTLDLTKSVIIVGILLFVFLGAKNSLIATISIPLVLLVVFGVGLLAGQSINRITLFALILSLGLLVDDAIVVVENIARYFRLYPNEKKITLIIRAVDEVGGALALSTFTMALAFVPMAFVTGMMGPYMGPIPFFVPAALFASLLFAVTINPFLALLFSAQHETAGKTAGASYETGVFFRVLKWVEHRYAHALSALLENRRSRRLFLGSVFAVLFVSLLLPLTPLVPFRMLPKADKDQFSVYVDLPLGTDVQTTDTLVQKLESLILKQTDTVAVEAFVGEAPVVDFNGLFRGSTARVGGHQATLKVHLTPHEERQTSSENLASLLRQEVAVFTNEHPDVTLRLVEDPPGPPVLSTFLLKVQGGDEVVREKMVQHLKSMAQETAGVVDLKTSLPERGFALTYRINAEKAALLRVDPRDISTAVQAALSGVSVGLRHTSDQSEGRQAEEEYIVVRFAPELRKNESALAHIRLTSAAGQSVPLTEVIERVDAPLDTTILSDTREKTTYLSGEMEGRSVIYAVLDLIPTLRTLAVEDTSLRLVSWSLFGMQYEDVTTHERYRVTLGGEWELTLEVFRDLGLAMGLALFLIYFVLATKTESLFVPLLIMVSIPLTLIGVLPGFAVLHALTGTYFNATSMIGVIALSGLAVKNAVIYLEYLEPLKASGKSLAESLVETGRIRLLPIVLTSLAAILGSLTIVSDPVWEGLGWSIIFGLTASTLLTLLVFPLVYFAFKHDSWREKKD